MERGSGLNGCSGEDQDEAVPEAAATAVLGAGGEGKSWRGGLRGGLRGRARALHWKRD